MGHFARKLSLPAVAAAAAAVVAVAVIDAGASAAHVDGHESGGGSTPAAGLAMQVAGQGRLEAHPPGQIDGARYEGRFSIFGIDDSKGAVFGDDVSLFDEHCVAAHGRGPQCAHFVAVRSGSVLEGFSTGDGPSFPGHEVGRSTSATRLRIFFDPHPDGTRNYDDRTTFVDRGTLIATYRAQEYFGIDAASGVFDSRTAYSLISSRPVTYNGHTVDLGRMFSRMSELDHGRNPEPATHTEPIPYQEPWFANRGPGDFASRFSVNGTMLAVTP